MRAKRQSDEKQDDDLALSVLVIVVCIVVVNEQVMKSEGCVAVQ